MEKHIIYLITDTNRVCIEAGYCTDITHILLELRPDAQSPFSYSAKCNRVVYMEKFNSYEEAQKRKLELGFYTHMMKERLIRKQNPNWLNIATGTVTSGMVNKFGLASYS